MRMAYDMYVSTHGMDDVLRDSMHIFEEYVSMECPEIFQVVEMTLFCESHELLPCMVLTAGCWMDSRWSRDIRNGWGCGMQELRSRGGSLPAACARAQGGRLPRACCVSLCVRGGRLSERCVDGRQAP
jgi:hypothetical protein